MWKKFDKEKKVTLLNLFISRYFAIGEVADACMRESERGDRELGNQQTDSHADYITTTRTIHQPDPQPDEQKARGLI